MCHESRRSFSDVTASAFVREFNDTSRCDQFTDFSSLRKDLKDRMSLHDPKILDRVMKFKETAEDEEVVAQACLHYGKWHEKNLVSALSWNN